MSGVWVLLLLVLALFGLSLLFEVVFYKEERQS